VRRHIKCPRKGIPPHPSLRIKFGLSNCLQIARTDKYAFDLSKVGATRRVK